MPDVPRWRVSGDWFDTCNCSIPCPCTFAQPPTGETCEGILAWNIRPGNYGDIRLEGLSVMALGMFKGNIWEGQTKATMAPDDLWRTGRRLARHVCEHHR